MDYWSEKWTQMDENLNEKTDIKNVEEISESVGRRKHAFYLLKDFQFENIGFEPTREMIEKEIETVSKATEQELAESAKLIETEYHSLDYDDVARFESFGYDQREGFVRGNPFLTLPTTQLAASDISTVFKNKSKSPKKSRERADTVFFVPTERNLTAEDALQVTHLPLVLEAMDDDSVGSILYKHYPNGIHGYNQNSYEINFEMLYNIMKKFLLKCTQPHLLYYALYRNFPNYGTQEEFTEMFPRLVEQFSGANGLLGLENWRAKKKDGELFDIVNPFDRKNYLVKKITVKSAYWGSRCSEYCFKSLQPEDLNPAMREVLSNVEDDQIVLYIKKSISKTNASFLNALLNNREETIVMFCETAKKCGQQDCADSFRVLLGNCIPKSKLRIPIIDNYKKRDQRFRTAMKRTNDQLTMNNEILDLICSVTPCSHLGPCGPEVADCNCDLMCTINCGCDDNCARKFVGCRCVKGQCKTSNCPCYKIGFECDQRTCGPCAHDDSTCKNRAITRGVTKRVAVQKSRIAGVGLFMLETAEKDDYLGEYTGEVISDAEMERRGAVDKLSISYAFNLGSKTGLDSSRAGNLFRYANNDKDHPNCHVLFRNVDGKPRIGFWASKKLHVGEELFFDYCYDAENVHTFFETRPEDRVKKTAYKPVETVVKKYKEEKKRKSDNFSIPSSSSSDIPEVLETQTRSGRVTRRRTFGYIG